MLYLRNTGNDANPGTLELPLATPEEAVRRFQLPDPLGRGHKVVECTGYTVSNTDPLRMDFPRAAHKYEFDFSRPGGADNGREDIWDIPIEFRADPILVTTVPVTGVTIDTATGLATINVSSALVPNALVGNFVWKGLFEQGVIESNTVNSITVAGYTTDYSGTLKIYKQSCTIDRPISFSSEALLLFNGIKFGPEFHVFADRWLLFSRCYFDDTDLGFFAEGRVFVVDCYQIGGYFRSDGAGYNVIGCVFDNVTFGGHGTGGSGLADFEYCIANGCTPMGQGNHESATGIEITRMLIKNAQSYGIHRQSPYGSRTTKVRIENAATGGVLIDCAGGFHKFSEVVGTNGGFGVTMKNGVQALDQGNNSITGASGDISLGGTTTTWATLAALASGQSINDMASAFPHFCRFMK